MSENLLDLDSFLARFNTDEACAEYLFQVKWPQGFVCPRCGYRQAYKISTRRLPIYECIQCHHQTSLTVGTVMEGSRTDLRKWLTALFLMSTEGISALKLSQIIKVTYKTAWLMLHKIRHAVNQEDASNLLSGLVEVNDTAYGKPYNPSFDRHPQEHPILVGASMENQEEPIYVKMKLLPPAHLQENRIMRFGREKFLEQHVQPNTTDIQFVIGRYTPRKHKKLFHHFAEANQWIQETFHGLGLRHLQSYFNEFCYRLNLQLQQQPIFERLSVLCMSYQTITYGNLTRGRRRFKFF